MDINFDGVARVLIHPDDIAPGALAALKARAAAAGASVMVSRIVEPGRAVVLPRGVPEFLPCPDPHPEETL